MPDYYSKVPFNAIVRTGFGFGALISTAKLFFQIEKVPLTTDGSFNVSIRSMTTVELNLANQTLGKAISQSAPDLSITGLGGSKASPGFELMSLLLVIPVVVLLKRKRINIKR